MVVRYEHAYGQRIRGISTEITDYSFSTRAWNHLAVHVLTIAIGAFVVLSGKGTKRHWWPERAYVGRMVAVSVSVFMSYALFGGFEPSGRLHLNLAVTQKYLQARRES